MAKSVRFELQRKDGTRWVPFITSTTKAEVIHLGLLYTEAGGTLRIARVTTETYPVAQIHLL